MKSKRSVGVPALRRRAEAQLRKQSSASGKPKSAGSPERLLHELQVHQIELEMQNTELRDGRDKMEALLEKYVDLYDFAPVGYFSLDEQGMILEVNLTGAALLGVERSRLINRPLARFVAPASQPVILAFLKQIFNGTGKQACEAALIKEDAATFWARLQGASAIAVTGPRTWCRVAVSDITLHRQAEDLLRRNEALFTALIQQAPVGVYVVDDQLRLREVNPKARPVFSKVHPLIGRDFSEAIHILWPAKVADEVVKRFRHTLATGEPYLSPEFTEQRRDTGVTESYEWQLQRITLPAGQYGVVCFFTDITERKQAEATQRRVEVLAASNRKLEQEIVRRRAGEAALKISEAEQRQMLARSEHMQKQLRQLSHQVLQAEEEERKRISRELHDQIAQSLVGINVHLANLSRELAVNPKGAERKIVRTQRLVEKSVDVVHRFARELRPTVLDDLGLLPALHAFLKDFTKRTGIHVHLTTSHSSRIEQVDNDMRTALYRVVQAALANIAQHARASRVTVSLRKLANAIRIEINDNGIGFNVERVLFAKRYKRLGLLGMRERVEMVGGSFALDSTPGKGTAIWAQIPFHKASKPRKHS